MFLIYILLLFRVHFVSHGAICILLLGLEFTYVHFLLCPHALFLLKALQFAVGQVLLGSFTLALVHESPG